MKGEASSSETVEPKLLTEVAEVRRLSKEQAAQALPVRVRGVVTWRSSGETFTIQDQSDGIYISLSKARRDKIWKGSDAVAAKIRKGMEVEIEGRSDPGGYAPIILPVSVRLLGQKPLPPPLAMIPARFFSGADDAQRIELRGTVQGFYPWSDGVTLILDANPGRFTAQVFRSAAPDPASLVDAEVKLRGIAATRFNTRGEATGSRVIVGSRNDLIVIKPPPPPDAIPLVELNRLLPFRPDPIGPHRVRVEGTVTFSLPGRFFYLQEGNNAIRVETVSQLLMKPGDRVEAAGFVEISRGIGSLKDATVRKIGASGFPEPMTISPEEILAFNRSTGKRTRPHDYDGHVIRCRARLLAVQSELYGRPLRTLTLERPDLKAPGRSLVFRALLSDGDTQALDLLRPGSELEVTGLVQLNYDLRDSPPHTLRTIPASLDLILRSAGDVRVLGEPSWWTRSRFRAALVAMLLALGAALVWSLQLKRQVRRKSKLLILEMGARRDAAIEFRTTMRERNRLAANLHDTLPQTMRGLGLQLDTCELSLRRLGIESLPPLGVARRMVDYAVNELRGAVWEMRSLSLRGRSFSAALQEVVDRVGSGHATKISTTTNGPLEGMPEFVSGNLLLIVQEALRNSLQHGNPGNISVNITTEAAGTPILLEVCDDGCGFTPGSQKGPELGHYGIVGMRERTERLGGSLRVESWPGHGARIVAELCQHALDDDFVMDQKLPDPPVSQLCRE